MELVSCLTPDGVRLDGLWTAGSGSSQLGVDVVIMHHCVSGTFYGTGFYNAAVEHLAKKGVAVLRVNNRGHDIVNRQTKPGGGFFYLGAAFETVDDCRIDWRAWNDVAERRGARRIALWGHSLGAVKTLYYANKERDSRVVAAIASSPPRFSHAQYKTDPLEWPLFERQLEEAKALVAAGKGDTLLSVTRPASLMMAARSYVEKYAPPEGLDYTRFIPTIAHPVLLTMGRLEGIESKPGSSRISLYGSDQYLRDLAATHTQMGYALVPGADHFYTGVERALTDVVLGFLRDRLG
ncbi:MAG: alpha/beta fold hydrolase [Alphaproteobacteria bacterium]|nr:alpha/beta fold hydrolase [Alphaproteobacteria bacterium]